MRRVFVPVFVLGALLATAVPVSAQGFGLGGRFAWVRQDVDVDADSVRFFGLHMRAIGGRSGFELSFDRHTESFELVNEKVIETPIQASLLVRLAQGSLAPYLLGGPGWYRRTVEPIDGPEDSGDSTTEFGWHAGGGLEILAGRHFGIHGDYRYTFLDFGGDDERRTKGSSAGCFRVTRGRCGRWGRPSTSEATLSVPRPHQVAWRAAAGGPTKVERAEGSLSFQPVGRPDTTGCPSIARAHSKGVRPAQAIEAKGIDGCCPGHSSHDQRQRGNHVRPGRRHHYGL